MVLNPQFSIDERTTLPDFSLGGVRYHPDVPHLDHRIREGLEEGVLAAREPVDDRRRRPHCERVRLELLVGLEEAAVHLEVCEVVLVELVGCGRVEVVQGRPVAVPWASLGQEGPVARAEGRVWPVRPAEVVQPVRDELALHAAESVRA